ncbi:Rhodanese-like domain-containing protein 4A [Nymphaea thermarum]|nr:Rhodanese-like domain-containing protein 4A [Nymphaea thermarum]
MEEVLLASRCSCSSPYAHKRLSKFQAIPSHPPRTSCPSSLVKFSSYSSSSSSLLTTLLSLRPNISSVIGNSVQLKRSFARDVNLLCPTILSSSSSPSCSSNVTAAHLRTSTVSGGTLHHLVVGLSSVLLLVFATPLLCSSALAADAAAINESSSKISLESALVSIDDFFNRYPYFVASVTFIWLVVIPLTQEYLRKFKYVSAIDGFRKLRDDPSSQLLDIRKRKSVEAVGSIDLKSLKKTTALVEYLEADEAGFVKKVLQEFRDPSNTTLYITDSLDGNSLRVAQLLHEKGGFKAAYAIKGGIQGKEGWQEIQGTLLPSSVHVHPRKRKGKGSILFNRKEVEDIRVDSGVELEKNSESKIPSTKRSESV